MIYKQSSYSNSQIYDLLTRPKAFWMEGLDFNALNYGSEYSKIRGNNRKLAISGNNESYLSITPEMGFPNNIEFYLREPRMVLTESTHIGNYDIICFELNLQQLIQIFKEKEIRFNL